MAPIFAPTLVGKGGNLVLNPRTDIPKLMRLHDQDKLKLDELMTRHEGENIRAVIEFSGDEQGRAAAPAQTSSVLVSTRAEFFTR